MVVASFIKIAVIIVIAVFLIVGLIAVISLKKNKEDEPSILDVTTVGVPSSSEAQDFSYGYERDETVVMQPVNQTEEVQTEAVVTNTEVPVESDQQPSSETQDETKEEE